MVVEETVNWAPDCSLRLSCVWDVELDRQALLKGWRPVEEVKTFRMSDVFFAHYFGGLIGDRVKNSLDSDLIWLSLRH